PGNGLDDSPRKHHADIASLDTGSGAVTSRRDGIIRLEVFLAAVKHRIIDVQCGVPVYDYRTSIILSDLYGPVERIVKGSAASVSIIDLSDPFDVALCLCFIDCLNCKTGDSITDVLLDPALTHRDLGISSGKQEFIVACPPCIIAVTPPL